MSVNVVYNGIFCKEIWVLFIWGLVVSRALIKQDHWHLFFWFFFLSRVSLLAPLFLPSLSSSLLSTCRPLMSAGTASQRLAGVGSRQGAISYQHPALQQASMGRLSPCFIIGLSDLQNHGPLYSTAPGCLPFKGIGDCTALHPGVAWKFETHRTVFHLVNMFATAVDPSELKVTVKGPCLLRFQQWQRAKV